MKGHKKSFISGFLLALILMCGVSMVTGSGASASTAKKAVTINYKDIKICIDGQMVTPKDANGKVVEPFILDGTTYLPVRAVGSAFGKEVDYDGTTHTVYIGAKPAASTAADSVRFVGNWHATVDMTDELNQILTADPEMTELANYFKVDSFTLKVNVTFNSDGTYKITVDQTVLNQTAEKAVASLKAGMLAYFKDMLEQQAEEAGITLDELLNALGVNSVEGALAASGVDLDTSTLLSEFMAASSIFESSGTYTTNNGQLFLFNSADNSISVNSYQFTSATQFKLLDTNDTGLGDLVFNKQ